MSRHLPVMPRAAAPRSDFALLGVAAGADEAALRQAFLEAVKAARPDRGGDPERYREIIAAYRRLEARPRHEDLDVRMDLALEPRQAKDGGPRLVRLPTGRTVRVTVPAGVQTGRTLRLRRQGFSAPGRWGDVYLRIVVAQPAPAPDLKPTAADLRRRFAEAWAA